MNFEEILPIMKEGKKFRLPEWEEKHYLSIDQYGNCIFKGDNNFVCRIFEISFVEIMSNMWEEYK